MAVTGLPEPQQMHAVLMVRFAFECLRTIDEITKDLETSLGPDTTGRIVFVCYDDGLVGVSKLVALFFKNPNQI